MIGVRNPIPGVVYRPAADSARYAQQGVLTQDTLVSAFADVVARHPDRVAISEVGLTISYRAFDDITDRVAAGLLRFGLKPLDRVVFQLANSKELLFSYVACLKAGLIPICTLAAHRQHEIGYLARHAGAKAHFIDGDNEKFDFVAFARAMRRDIPTMEHIVVMRAGGGLDKTDNIHALESLSEGVDLAQAAKRSPASSATPGRSRSSSSPAARPGCRRSSPASTTSTSTPSAP